MSWRLNEYNTSSEIVEICDSTNCGFATVFKGENEQETKLILAAPEMYELLLAFYKRRNEWILETTDGDIIFDELKNLLKRLE